MMHSISPCQVFIPAMSAYSFTTHHLASRLPSILHAFCMVSYKGDLYKLLLVKVMAAPTISISVEENLGDPIDTRVDIIHPEPITAVAFPVAAVEELTTLRFRVDIAEVENASLRARIKTNVAVKKITRNHERLARIRIEQQLVAVQEKMSKKLDSEFNEEENILEMADTQAEIILSKIYTTSQSLRAHAKKDSQETGASYKYCVHLAYVAHTTSAPALSSPSTPSPQPTVQSPNDALMATMSQIANLLSGFQKQFPPTNNQLRTSSNSRNRANGCMMVTLLLDNQFRGRIQCKEPKRKMDSQYFKDKALLMEAKENGDLSSGDTQEEHLDSVAETEIETIRSLSMIAILTDLQTQLDGHAKVNQEKCLEIETLKNELLQCKQEICRLDTHKVLTKLLLKNKVRQEQALVIQRNKRNAELVQENDLLKSTLSGKEKSIAFLQSEKEKILSEKKELADSYLDEIVCLKTANKVARDMLQRFNMPTQTIPMLSKKPKKATDDLHKDILGTRNPGLGYMAKRAQPVLYDADTFLHPAHHPVSIWDSGRYTSSASNAIFEINKLSKQLQGKDDTIRNLDAQINIMKVLNVGSTDGSCDQQALETDRIQLKDTITSLRIQLDGLKVENVPKGSLVVQIVLCEKREYLGLHFRTVVTVVVRRKELLMEVGLVLCSSLRKVFHYSYGLEALFGSLCYPTNDYDDVGKLKAKDIGIFVGYAPTKKAYRILQQTKRGKIQETVHVTFDELTEGLTSVQTSSGLVPQQMTYVPNSTELELTALQSRRSRSELVKDPEPPSVPPTKKQVHDLFQWFDDDEVIPPLVVLIPPVHVPAAPAPENANGSPSTTVISEGAPAVTESLLPHQVPLPNTSDSDIETLFDNVDSNVFDTYNAPETDSEASSSNSVNIDVTPHNQLPHVQKWTQAHPLENILSIRAGLRAMQEEIHEFELGNVYGDVLKNKARLSWRKGYRRYWLDFEESFAPVARLEAIRLFIAHAAKPTEMHLTAIKRIF
ncbi:hypothetical protein Tco_0620648 [Tanacetum coccineum]